jgi:hypothetical protein
LGTRKKKPPPLRSDGEINKPSIFLAKEKNFPKLLKTMIAHHLDGRNQFKSFLILLQR